MTYVPPKKEEDKGGGGIGDAIYVFLFYLIEGLFIFIGIPVLVLAIAIIPMAMYAIITGGSFGTDWVLYLVGVIIVFTQIMALQYFVRKFILKPHKMKFGEWLRWKFSPTEIKKRKAEKAARSKRMDEWYDGMEKIHERKELIKNEQSYDLRDEWFQGEDPDEVEKTGIVITETPIEESYPISNEPEEIADTEVIVLGSEESEG